MGRPRKAIELHKQEGTYKPSRHGDGAPLLLAGRGVPDMPPGFNADQKKVWQSLTGFLEHFSLLDLVDVFVLEDVTSSVATARWARREKNKLKRTDEDYFAAYNLFARIERQSWAAFRASVPKLGLSPEARAKFVAAGISAAAGKLANLTAAEKLAARKAEQASKRAAEQAQTIEGEVVE